MLWRQPTRTYRKQLEDVSPRQVKPLLLVVRWTGNRDVAQVLRKQNHEHDGAEK